MDVKKRVEEVFRETGDVAETVYVLDQEIEEYLVERYVEEGGSEKLEEYVEKRKRPLMAEALRHLLRLLEAQ